MSLEFPGLSLTLNPEAIVLQSQQALRTLSSAVVGGGLTDTRYILNRHVHKNYDHADPVADLKAFAANLGIEEPFVGLMTAVYLDRAQTLTLSESGVTVAAVVTAGLSNPTSAGLSPPVVLRGPGTINIILVVEAPLSPAAMVNAVISATEAKTDVLLQHRVLTPENDLATGTSTDSVVVACTQQSNQLSYAGPATTIGWLIGRCVRRGLEAALKEWNE